MHTRSAEELKTITELMHDAQLLHVEWDPTLARACLLFSCLRRNLDGSKMEDTSIEFQLSNVQAIVVGYESLSISTRPSQMELSGRISLDSLGNVQSGDVGDMVHINSSGCTDGVINAAVVDWLRGDLESVNSSAYRVCVVVKGHDIGVPEADVEILFACDDFEPFSGSVPLDIDTWKAQTQAWWDGWERYWDEQDKSGGGGDDVREEDLFIPAGKSDVNPDYRPPDEPAFELEPHDVPVEILEPLCNTFEGYLAGDWMRVASADPDPESTLEEQANRMHEEWKKGNELGPFFGNWGYARSVDSWWIEGNRACVVVRGIEHTEGDEQDPPENHEAIWEFSLKPVNGNWVIRSHSQCWANAGPEERRLPESEKPWLKRWRSGKVE